MSKQNVSRNLRLCMQIAVAVAPALACNVVLDLGTPNVVQHARAAASDVTSTSLQACRCPSCSASGCPDGAPCGPPLYYVAGAPGAVQLSSPTGPARYYGAAAGELDGQRIYVASPGCLVKLGVLTSYMAVGTRFYLGLYGDVGGLTGYPNVPLWRSPQPATVQSFPAQVRQEQEIDVVPAIQVPAGYYWLVEVFEADTSIEVSASAPIPWARTNVTFGALFPSPFPGDPSILIPPQAPPIVYAVVTNP